MQPLKRLSLALALALALSAPVAAQGHDEILLLDVCVNERCFGVGMVAVRGEKVLIDREALLAAGLDPTGMASERVGNRELVEAARMAPGVTVAVDRAQLRVDLRQSAEDMRVQRVDLQARPTIDPATLPWTAFVNYATSAGSGQGDDDAGLESLFLDAALGRGHAALRSTAYWSDGIGWRRGLTRFEYDEVAHLRRWTLGDQFAQARDPLGGGALLGGAGVERAFDQDPYLVTFPQPFYSGVLQVPGTVEVYANGALIARHELNAGPFTLSNLGISPGRSDLRVVVRDPFGNRTELSSASFYGTSTLLAPGLSDYAVRLGRVRLDNGFGDRGYGDDTALQAWYRRGMGSAWTLGGRIEGDARLRNAGADLALRLPFGEIGFSVAASDHEEAGRGRAASLTYSYAGRWFGFGFGARRFDEGYRRLGDAWLPGGDMLFGGRLREDDFVGVSLSPFERLSLQLNHSRQRREDWPTEYNTGLVVSWGLSGRAQLLMSVQQYRGGLQRDADTSAMLSFSYAFDRSSAGANVRHDDSGTGYGFDARRSRQQDIDWGYDVSAQRAGDYDSGNGQLEYQGRHGRYAVQAERFGSDSSGRLLASGALVAIGGRVLATPPLESGFALVRVPGLPDATLLRENVAAGRTDAEGDLLVRGLVPFYANKVSLDNVAVPVEYDIRIGTRDVAVPRNTGAIVSLEVGVVHAVTGHVQLASAAGVRPAAFGLLRLRRDGTEIQSPLGGSGRYYFENLAPGSYDAEVERDGTMLARCALRVPEAQATGITRLGELVCAEAATQGEQP